jgi:hypothetical protein
MMKLEKRSLKMCIKIYVSSGDGGGRKTAHHVMLKSGQYKAE